MDAKIKAMLASYGRSVLGAVLALYMAGITDPMDLWTALVAAAAPVILRAINPNDPAFGRVPEVAVVEASLQAAVAETVAKKSAPKKAAKKAVKKSGGKPSSSAM